MITVTKPKTFNIVCPRCGTKISIPFEDYLKYTEYYDGESNYWYEPKTIICTEKINGEKVEVSRFRFDCPSCNEGIPMNFSNAECYFSYSEYGFNTGAHCSVNYNFVSENIDVKDAMGVYDNEEEDC